MSCVQVCYGKRITRATVRLKFSEKDKRGSMAFTHQPWQWLFLEDGQALQ